MGKGKKKVGKGGVKEIEELESLQISEDPSTSGTQVAEEEDEGGLTGAARRKKKKETKKAEKDAKKVEKSVKDVSEAPGTSVAIESTSPPSTLADEGPKPKEEVPKPKEEVPKAKVEVPKPAEEEDGGLGLGGPRKRQPRKKKPADAAKAAAGAATPVQGPATTSSFPAPSVLGPAPQSLAPAIQPATSGPPPQTAPSKWGIPSPTPAVVSAGPQQGAYRPPPQTVLPRQPSTSGPPTSAGDYGRPGPSQALPASASLQAVSRPDSSQQTRATSSEVACRFKIPKKILGNQVPARQISVLTNYLPMTIKPLKIYRYDVSFKPDRPKKFLGKVFALSKEKHFRQNLIAFDQIKNCYSLTQLKDVSQNDRYLTNVELKDPNGKVMAFEVSYKYTGLVDLGTIMAYVKSGATSLSPPTEAIQCIDVILRQGTLESYVKAGRQFFKRPARPIDLGDGLEMWTGLFQSGIFTSRAFINIDVAHKGFPKQQPLVQALNDFRLDPKKPLEMQRGRGNENFQIFLKGLRVVATIGGDSSGKGMKREFICNGIVGSCKTEKFCFEDPNGKKTMMTVQEYFERVKNVRIRYPDLNCVWVGPREKTIFYPMELLEVSYGQAQNKQLNENQLATMVRQAATPPDERKKKIEEVIQNMNYSKNDYFKKFGLEISDQFHPVRAKILQPPQLIVGDGQTVFPKRGQWMANKVFKAEPLQAWGVIAVEVDPNRCQPDILIDLMMSQGAMMGMAVSQPILKRFNVRIQELQSVLYNALERGVNFLFVIVSTRGRDYYHKVKQLAEREVGILTQCIKEFTATTRMNQATARNILLKVNSKLMGINQTLSQRSLPRCLQGADVMVVGADVTHPSPDQSNIPSIAAVTASIDTKCFVYNIQLSIQTPKKEMIVEFEDMMLEHLQVYRKHQGGKLPRKIYVFRDGVSEGQFAQVMNSELQAVHNAYRTVAGPTAKPEVLFLLVQKRHHTRLFVPNSSYNVEPGTVVDEDIVHASELDFYMVSHQAIKGTARPTRYHAVCNDGGLAHDEVEQLAYYLCHLYSRCSRAVSYPTPTYYAHLACLRARSLTFGEKFDNKELELRPKRLRVMDKILQFSRMFFV